MLIAIILTLSLLSALGAALGVGVSLALLWVVPLTLVGSLLGWLILAFLFLWISCLLAPTEPRAHDSRFYRILVELYVDAVVTLAGVKFQPRGMENIPKDGRFMLVCNHLHEADPVVLLHFFKGKQLSFISKKENSTMFLVGKIMPQLMCQLVDRENDREALKAILKCIQLIKDDEVSVGVFPEGYIHKQKKFQHFRPGVFKIAQKAKVPIVVCTVANTHKILKNLTQLKRTTVPVHLLTVLQPEFFADKTTVELAEYVHDMMAEDLGEEYRLEENT